MTLRPRICWRSLWIGAYWSQRLRKIYIQPIPFFCLVIGFPKKRRLWWWFLTLAFVLTGCVAPTGEGTGGGVPAGCDAAGETSAEDACLAAVHILESYGCTFSSACNASCPSGEVVCRASVTSCVTAAAQDLENATEAERPTACQNAAIYCNDVLTCEAP